MNVKCRHNNHTADKRTFSYKGGSVDLFKGQFVFVEERIAQLYPNVFTIIPEALPQDEEIKPDPDDATDEPEIIEPEATEEEVIKQMEDDIPEEQTEAYDGEDVDTEPLPEDHGAVQLKEAINDYKTKKKLATYAKDCNVELKSTTLKAMKEELITLWEL